MEVHRFYPVHSQFYEIARLWSMETIFSPAPTMAGMQLTLTRLKELRGDIDTVIAELETELENEAWLT